MKHQDRTPPPGGMGYPLYSGLYRDATSKRGPFFRLGDIKGQEFHELEYTKGKGTAFLVFKKYLSNYLEQTNRMVDSFN